MFSIIQRLRGLLTPVLEVQEPVQKWERPTEYGDLPPEAVRWMLTHMKCPYCQIGSLYDGPEGGMSINMFCGNPDYDSRFNVVPYPGMDWGQFIGPCPPEFLAQRRREIGQEQHRRRAAQRTSSAERDSS